jgi:hypothetical protein
MQPILLGTEDQVFNILGNFLKEILDPTVEIVRGQENRVPEPTASDFVVMWPLTQMRLATNEESENDIAFTGSINGTTLTVTAMIQGTIANGNTLYGAGIPDSPPVTIISQLSGTPGGVGTYQISTSLTVTSETIQVGYKSSQQSTQRTFQFDVHGPNSSNNAQIITTLWRDEYAVTQFKTLIAALSPPGQFEMAPLFANDPRQIPFLNAEQQYENKWAVEAVFQINPIVQTQMQFAGSVSVTPVSVSANYPA